MKNMRHLIKLDEPAGKWADGLPLGNGRLGAMIMGKVNDETIIINEETIWYGKDRKRQNQEGSRYWREIRSLLLEGKIKEAQFGARMVMSATPKYPNPYQLAGDLRFRFFDHDGKVQQYKRVLDIDNAISEISYTLNGIRYCREHFVSRRYQIFATKLTCDHPEKITLSVNMNRRPYEEYTGKIDDTTVYNCGRCGDGGISYYTGITMDTDNGSVNTLADFVYCTKANTVYIYIACGTDFADPDYREKVLSRLKKAKNDGYEKIKAAHICDYKNLYGRMELSLGVPKEPEICTDKQLKILRKGGDDYLLYLTETLFCYGRYLMISSSMDCLLPANLQGIWNGDYQPSWESGYTININEEMNYWMVEKCNLSECHKPLLEQVKRIARKGEKTARGLYGCRGFCAHHNIDIWDCTEPIGLYDASFCWPMGGVWMSLHMYEHYLYTQDKEFLVQDALPVMREAIRFFEDYLYEREDGFWVTGPSQSPENSYVTENGVVGNLSMGPSMDMQLLRELIRSYLEGLKEAEMDQPQEAEMLNGILNKLSPIQLNDEGRIMEWEKDYGEVDPGHRHLSMLYALHPGTQISENTPEFFDAARKTIDTRVKNGSGHTGWSRAWIACMEARMKDGQKTGEHLRRLLELSIQDNLLNSHPPYQIDGNFGMAEAVCEALIQSHNGYIELLPALPKEWVSGEIKGIVLRGAVEAHLRWKDKKVVFLKLKAKSEKSVEVRFGKLHKCVILKSGEWVRIW